ncbi:MAG: gamma-glutamyltransferase, partial [Bacteroidetes bacterium]|nr:gamma-glutamyltransferase [Bacteroidota bacterium]
MRLPNPPGICIRRWCHYPHNRSNLKRFEAGDPAFQVLEAGGNAIDAGCAGGMALGVVQSEFVSFGGVAPIMIRPADGGEVVTITGLGHWPKAASLEV